MIRTPLLVPAFSSKGFPPNPGKGDGEEKDDGLSEVSLYVDFAAGLLGASALVSAFDIQHRQIVDTSAFADGSFAGSVYGTPQLLIIDSGGYELRSDFDETDTYRDITANRDFTPEDYTSLVDSFADVTAVLVNYDPDIEAEDATPSYEEQIAAAQNWFTERGPNYQSDFLLKPPGGSGTHNVKNLAPVCTQLGAFDFIGVTEKELGDTIRKRVRNLARLRGLLDEEGVDKPIHVFGSLDPLLSPLYFFAGAEVFDGLSWLRYAYHDHRCVYAKVPSVLEHHLDQKEWQWKFQVCGRNLVYLQDLQEEMLGFLHDDYNVGQFSNAEFLEPAVMKLKKEIEGG